MIYSYEAKDREGRTVTGSLDARDERAAAGQVRDMGYFVMRLAPLPGSAVGGQGVVGREAAGSAGITYDQNGFVRIASPPASSWRWMLLHLVYPIWSGVGLRDLALFYRQFAAMINAGVPVYQCLTTLIAQTGNPTLRKCLRTIGEQVQRGGSLSGAMAIYPWIFLDYHRAMVVAGETSGRLDLMFARLASALEQEHAMRGIIKRELFLPGLELHALFLLPPLVMLVVYHDVRGYVHAAILPLLATYLAILGLYVLTRLASQFKVAYDAVTANLPGIGGAVRWIALARFARALSSMYSAGVPIPRAIQLAAAAGGNAYLEAKMVRAIPKLEGGGGLVEALAQTGAFPPMVVSMLGTGESTGNLDQMMDKVAEYYEQESAVRLHQIGVTLGVVVTILVGIRILFVLIDFYTGYFNNLFKETQ